MKECQEYELLKKGESRSMRGSTGFFNNKDATIQSQLTRRKMGMFSTLDTSGKCSQLVSHLSHKG